jgi:hypothetical protein
MTLFAKWLILIGIITTAAGIVLLVTGFIPFPNRFPGDIRIERKNSTFYFPIVTCIVLSFLLTLIFWIASRFK